MERLQIAIEKARRSRRERLTQPDLGPAILDGEAGAKGQVAARAPEDPGPATETRAETPRTGTPAPAEAAAAAARAEDPWLALAEIKLQPKVMQRRRIVTYDPGVSALPFDLLRTRILQQSKKEGWRRLAVVSPHSGAGKTTLVANLAFSFGRQADMRSLVLDFDLRRPMLGSLLGVTPKQSLVDVLRGRIGFAEQALGYRNNLAFGLNRAPTRAAAELLQSRETGRILGEIEAIYQPDLVLFDMPPVLATDDALAFLGQVDAALIVAEAEKTPIRQIEAVEAQVADLTRVLGVVLNRCRYTGKDAGDYGYY